MRPSTLKFLLLALIVTAALPGAQAPAAPDSPRTLAHVSDE